MINNYLTFEEAVVFLKTNTSTLYKWLQSGKIPARKLGRQWRFDRQELENWLGSNDNKGETPHDHANLTELLTSRTAAPDSAGKTDTDVLLTHLILDAAHHHAVSLHFNPAGKSYEISYRINGSIKKLTTIPATLFQKLRQSFTSHSSPLNGEKEARIAWFRKKPNSTAQIRVHSQEIETLNGTHLTMRIIPGNMKTMPLEKVAPEANDQKTFSTWLARSSGIIFVSGLVGNGMTTVTCSLLGQCQQNGKNVFLIQDFPEILYPEINTVEVTPEDETGFSTAIKQIAASDADAIGISLNPATELESVIFKTAFRLASRGHLMIIQFNASSCTAVVDKIRKYAPEIIENAIPTLVSHQVLLPVDDNRRRAEFTLLELNTTQN